MHLNPIKDNVLIQRDPNKESTVNGIIRPESNFVFWRHGTVKKVGPGSAAHPEMSVAPGDRVMFTNNVGRTVDAENPDLVLVRDREIDLVVEAAA